MFIHTPLLPFLPCMCVHASLQKKATVRCATEVGSHLLSPANAQPACNSAEKLALAVEKTECLQCEDGRGSGGGEEVNESLTSPEDRQFLSSIASSQLDFVESSHTPAPPPPETSNSKRLHGIPCKRQPSPSPREPLAPKT